MPLDPNISLNIQPIQPVDLTKIQQLRLLMGQEELQRQQVLQSMTQQQLGQAQIEESRARLPGIQAVAEQQQYSARYNKDKANAAQKYTDPTTGIANRDLIANDLLSKGYWKESEELLRDTALREAQTLNNLRSDQDRQLAYTEFMEKNVGRIGMLLHALPENSRAGALDKQLMMLDQLAPQGAVKPSAALRNQFYNVDPNTGAQQFNNEKVDAVYRSQIAALNQENLKLEQIKNLTGAEGQDPNSALSKNLRQVVLERTGIQFPGSFSAAQLSNVPLLRGVIEAYSQAQIVPPSTRAEAAVKREDFGLLSQDMQAGLNIISDIESKNKLQLPTILGTRIKNLFEDKIMTNEEIKRLEAAAATYNKLNPDTKIDIYGMTLGQAKEFYNAQLRRANEGAAAAGRIERTQQLGRPPATEAEMRMPGVGQTSKDERLRVIESEFADALSKQNFNAAKDYLKELEGMKVPLGPYQQKLFEAQRGGAKTISMQKVREFAKQQNVPENAIIKDLERRGFTVK